MRTSTIAETSTGKLFTAATILIEQLVIILVRKGAADVASCWIGILHGWMTTSLSLESSKLPLVVIALIHWLLLLLVLHALVVLYIRPHSLVSVHFMLFRTVSMVILYLFLIDLFRVVAVIISSNTVLQIVIDIIVYLILDSAVFLRINVDVGMVIWRSLIFVGHVVLILVTVID